METTNQESTTKTQSSKGGVMPRDFGFLLGETITLSKLQRKANLTYNKAFGAIKEMIDNGSIKTYRNMPGCYIVLHEA